MNKHLKIVSPVVLATLSSLAVQVHAAGTAAGTPVTNTATLNYQINGVDQTAVEAEDTFNVDIKVDFALTRLLTTDPNDACRCCAASRPLSSPMLLISVAVGRRSEPRGPRGGWT